MAKTCWLKSWCKWCTSTMSNYLYIDGHRNALVCKWHVAGINLLENMPTELHVAAATTIKTIKYIKNNK